MSDAEKQRAYRAKRLAYTAPNLDRHKGIYFVEPPPKNKDKGKDE